MSDVDNGQSRQLSLLDIARFLWRNKLILTASILFFAISAIVLAFTLRPTYRSVVVFSPTENSSVGLGPLGGDLGGLAALAGINIGSGGKKSDEALAFLRSRAFTAGFIQRHELMPVLFARQWDSVGKAWRVTGADVPTIADAVDKFSNKIRQIGEDRRTGIVTLSILWTDRVVAADWANEIVAEADGALRARALAEQRRSIEYLKAEAAQTTVIEVRQTIYKVMESELKNAMLARTRDAFAFRVLDPAVPRDSKDRESPRRSLIVLLGAAVGLVTGVLVALIRQSRRGQRTSET